MPRSSRRSAGNTCSHVTIHTDQAGNIWFGTGLLQASRWEKDPAELVSAPWLVEAESVRLLGTVENAPLLVRLYNERLRSGTTGGVKICGLPRPAAVPSDGDEENQTIDRVFRHLLESQLPGSLGGFHSMSESDFRTYALLAVKNKRSKKLLKTLLQAHPAWPALSFLPSMQISTAEAIVREIVDPRFHVDPKNPDRTARLKSFFGVGRSKEQGLRNARAFLGGIPHWRCENYDRAALLFSAWFDQNCDVDLPDNFLMRIFRDFTENRNEEPAMSLLRTSYVFLRFVRDVWLDSLTPSRNYHEEVVVSAECDHPSRIQLRMHPCSRYSPTLFVPEHFFSRADEVSVWNLHLVNFR